MSLYEELKKNIENTIYQYAEVISQKYQIDEKEILELFNGTVSKTTSTKKVVPKKTLDTVDMNDISSERLNKCTKPELSALCKSKGLKCTGTKEVLLQRLLGKEESKSVSSSEEKKSTVTKPKVKPKTHPEKQVPVVEKLLQRSPAPLARRNEFGNYFYPGTKIVLDQKAVALGVQEDDGTVSELTEDDIDECKKYKITFKMPTNLDKNTDLENIKVEELDDDNLEKEQDEIVEEEEEEIEEIEDDE
jgi:hypothetical protein